MKKENALYFRTLPLTFLIAAGLGLRAQCQSDDAPSAANSSSDSIRLQSAMLDVAVPTTDLFSGHSNNLVQAAISPVAAAPEIVANPGRPALATSALLTPIGYLQVETGYLYAANSAGFSNRNAEEETMRVTLSPRTQLIVSSEAIASSIVSQHESTERGDTTGGIQVVLRPSEGMKPTISVSYLHLLWGGYATNLDIGGFANSVLIMASSDFGHFHVDANGFLSETEGPIRRAQFGQAVALTHPVTAKLSATAELRHFTEPLTGGEGLSVMWAGGYALRPNLVFDTGLIRGFLNDSTRWELASGVTYVLPHRLWGGSAHWLLP